MRTRRRIKRAIGLLVSNGAENRGPMPTRPSGSRRVGHRHL
jgi:hypothetical protein